VEVTELLLEEDIVFRLPAGGKKSALSKIAARLAKRADMDEAHIRAGLLDRERSSSTALGNGVAVPHAILDDLVHPVASFALLKEAVDFDAPDNTPVDLLLTLVWPRAAVREFLPTLASACRLLRRRVLRDMLRQARTPTEMFAILRFRLETVESEIGYHPEGIGTSRPSGEI
jgi:PTS system nitrogen regulatory IIA component